MSNETVAFFGICAEPDGVVESDGNGCELGKVGDPDAVTDTTAVGVKKAVADGDIGWKVGTGVVLAAIDAIWLGVA
jgi:hypothetical protein